MMPCLPQLPVDAVEPVQASSNGPRGKEAQPEQQAQRPNQLWPTWLRPYTLLICPAHLISSPAQLPFKARQLRSLFTCVVVPSTPFEGLGQCLVRMAHGGHQMGASNARHAAAWVWGRAVQVSSGKGKHGNIVCTATKGHAAAGRRGPAPCRARLAAQCGLHFGGRGGGRRTPRAENACRTSEQSQSSKGKTCRAGGVCGMVRSHGAVRRGPGALVQHGAGRGVHSTLRAGGGGMPQTRGARCLRAGGVAPASQGGQWSMAAVRWPSMSCLGQEHLCRGPAGAAPRRSVARGAPQPATHPPTHRRPQLTTSQWCARPSRCWPPPRSRWWAWRSRAG